MWRVTVFDQSIGTFVYFFFVRCENFALYHNKRLLRADPCCRSVIKEFAHAFNCVYRALKKQGLLSAAPRATLTHFSCSPNFPRASITRYTHAKHEQILKFTAISMISLLNTNVLAFAVCLSENSDSNTSSQVHRFIQGGGGA